MRTSAKVIEFPKARVRRKRSPRPFTTYYYLAPRDREPYKVGHATTVVNAERAALLEVQRMYCAQIVDEYGYLLSEVRWSSRNNIILRRVRSR